MANITTPVAAGDSKTAVKTKIVAILENWRGAGFASGGNTPATWGAARTLLNGVAALVVLTAIGANDSGADARAKINALNDDTAGGRFTGSSLDLQFANNKAYGAADPLAPLTVTRASSGMVEDASGVWTSVGNNVARRSNKGLLVEEARTNGIRNSALQGAVVGVPGTMPTNMSKTSLNGIVSEVVGVGVENGIDYIDLRFAGTLSNPFSGSAIINLEVGTVIAAAQNQVWSASAFCYVVAGNLTNVGALDLTMFENNAGGAQIAAGTTNITALTGPLSARRVSYVRTLTNISTAFVRPSITMTAANGAVIDFTLRIGLPQLELGATVTSPIRTTGAAATRAADNPVITNPASYANLTEGSMFVEWDEGIGAGAPSNRSIATLYVDASNYIRITVNSLGVVGFATVVAGGFSANLVGTNVLTAGQTVKAATRWKVNNFAARYSAAIGNPANDNSGAVPTGTFAINLGNFSNGTQCMNGYIRRFVLFPTAQNDAALNAMVA